MTKKIILTVVCALVLVGLLVGVKGLQFQTMFAQGANFVPPPETVTTTEVKRDTWQPTLTAVGSVAPMQGVMLSAEMSGTVKNIAFESGATVRAGELLMELDTSVEQAQLRAATASADLARLNLERARDLRAKTMMSQADLDSAEAQAKQANAQIDNIRAVIAKKTIRAPFAGRTRHPPGQSRPISRQRRRHRHPAIARSRVCGFRAAPAAPRPAQRGHDRAGYHRRVFGPEFRGQAHRHQLGSRCGHPQHPLAGHAGQSRRSLASRHVCQRRRRAARDGAVLVIPATAVLYAPYGDSVFVVEDKKDEKTGATGKVLNQRFVRLGKTRGDFVVVTSGLEAEQTIVTTGVFKLRNGISVVVDNKLAPNFQLAPKPANS
jgi:membrane fusion protein (multidrug efflux system)